MLGSAMGMECQRWGKDSAKRALTSGLVLGLLWAHEPCDPAKYGRGPQRRGNVVPLAVHLNHEYADFECAVDLAVLHEVPPHDPIVCGLRLQLFIWCRRGRADGQTTPLPRRRRNVPRKGLALLDIFAQVKFDVPENHFLGADKLLHNLQFDGAFGEVVALVDRDSHRGDDFAEAVVDLVVRDRTLGGAAAVLRVHGMGEVPFDVGAAGHQRNVVEVVYLPQR